MSTKSAYAVVRIRKNKDVMSYSIPESDIFFAMASSETDAFDQAGEIGWRLSAESYDSAMAMANPNYGTHSSPVYARPTFVENTLGSVMKYLRSVPDRTPEYIAVRVSRIGDPRISGANPYIIAWGGTAEPYIVPQVICCYASSYSDMLATVSLTDDFVISSFMATAGMSICPSDIIMLPYDPFQATATSPRVYAALPRSISPVVVSDPDPVTRSHGLAFPGPARYGERMMELV
mgnify:CR=1 FL=1